MTVEEKHNFIQKFFKLRGRQDLSSGLISALKSNRSLVPEDLQLNMRMLCNF